MSLWARLLTLQACWRPWQRLVRQWQHSSCSHGLQGISWGGRLTAHVLLRGFSSVAAWCSLQMRHAAAVRRLCVKQRLLPSAACCLGWPWRCYAQTHHCHWQLAVRQWACRLWQLLRLQMPGALQSTAASLSLLTASHC